MGLGGFLQHTVILCSTELQNVVQPFETFMKYHMWGAPILNAPPCILSAQVGKGFRQQQLSSLPDLCLGSLTVAAPSETNDSESSLAMGSNLLSGLAFPLRKALHHQIKFKMRQVNYSDDINDISFTTLLSALIAEHR